MVAAESFTGFSPFSETPKISLLSLPSGGVVKLGERINRNGATDTTVYTGRLYRREGIKTVAVKEISLDYDDEQKKQQILSQARREYLLSCALFEHGLGPQTYGILQKQDRIFLVMDYIKGKDLRRAGQLPLEEVISLARCVLETLFYLHDPHPGSACYQALVESFAPGDRPKIRHADIKPDNIMRDEDGRVVLIDFGAVRQEGTEKTLFGTLPYFAPEQLQFPTPGRRKGRQQRELAAQITSPHITRAADIYALSVVMWQLLTGMSHSGLLQMRGFESYSLTERLARYLNSQDHVSDMLSILEQTCPDIPPSVAHLLEVGLQSDPKKRFIAAFQMLEAVHDIQREIEQRKNGVSVAS